MGWKSNFARWVASLGVLVMCAHQAWADVGAGGYDGARWDPRHFKPLIDQTSDAECLQCHAEVLSSRVREQSTAGLRADRSLAWYQTLDTYAGAQDTFHRRHMSSAFAREVMDLRCNTCHQGHELRDEAPGTHVTSQGAGYTLRKQVDPDTCVMCHGKFNWEVMGLPGSWDEHGESFGNDCMACHAGIRTTRHRVNFLKAEAIEAAAQKSTDVCYGCHGGRAWYRISYPYPRHAWEGMDAEVPEWAKDRPTRSAPRFTAGIINSSQGPARAPGLLAFWRLTPENGLPSGTHNRWR